MNTNVPTNSNNHAHVRSCTNTSTNIHTTAITNANTNNTVRTNTPTDIDWHMLISSSQILILI